MIPAARSSQTSGAFERGRSRSGKFADKAPFVGLFFAMVAAVIGGISGCSGLVEAADFSTAGTGAAVSPSERHGVFKGASNPAGLCAVSLATTFSTAAATSARGRAGPESCPSSVSTSVRLRGLASGVFSRQPAISFSHEAGTGTVAPAAARTSETGMGTAFRIFGTRSSPTNGGAPARSLCIKTPKP